MGQEIVYCFKCQIRLTGADLEKGTAIRWQHHVACKNCVPAVLASLTPEERKSFEAHAPSPAPTARREAVPRPAPGSSTRLKHLKDRPAGPSRRPWLWVGVGGAVLVLVLLVAALSGRPSPPPAASTQPPAALPPKASPEDPAPKRARDGIEKAKRFMKEHPDDLDGQVAAASEAVKSADATSQFREAVELYDHAVSKRKAAHAAELEKIEKEAAAEADREEFKAALDRLERARSLHATPEWSSKVDAARDAIRKRAADLYARLLGEARDAAAAERLRARVTRWGLPEFGKELAELAARLAAEGLPWTPLFDGRTTAALRNPENWTVENGALTSKAERSIAVQSTREVSDGDVRIRFEIEPAGYATFKIRQGPEAGYGVEWNRPRILALAGKAHDLVFRLRGEEVTATLDGQPEPVKVFGKALRGQIQFSSTGRLRILALDVR